VGLLHKMRILVGALVHKPFMSRPAEVNLDESREPKVGEDKGGDVSTLEAQRRTGAEDTERVADLIAQQRDEGSG
jgi:hypothetical protein